MINHEYKANLTIKPHIDWEIKQLGLTYEDSFNGVVTQYYQKIINFEDSIVKDALIAMGWVPPPQTPISEEAKEFFMKKYGPKIKEAN